MTVKRIDEWRDVLHAEVRRFGTQACSVTSFQALRLILDGHDPNEQHRDKLRVTLYQIDK